MPGKAGRSGFRIPGCAVTLALAAMLAAVFMLFQPATSPTPVQAPVQAPVQPQVQAQPAQAQQLQAAVPANPSTSSSLQFPALTGRVVDAANIIPADEEARLTQKLEALETQSHRQLVIATLPSLQGYEISDYGYQLGRAWGIGSKAHNDGALLIVAPTERKMRIEVGYGLEAVLTDGLSSLIIQQTIIPKFKAGDMAGGIEAGTDAIIHQLTLPDDQARKLAAEAKPKAASGGSTLIPTIFWLFIFFIFFILPMLRRRRGGSSYGSGLGSVILWNALGSGGGSSSGWSSGGGGFSGGGGSFGGGGSSGSW